MDQKFLEEELEMRESRERRELQREALKMGQVLKPARRLIQFQELPRDVICGASGNCIHTRTQCADASLRVSLGSQEVLETWE